MNFVDAMRVVALGGKARRKAWQSGYIELGVHQEKQTIFYNNPSESKIDDFIIPKVYVTYTPYRRKRRFKGDPEEGYPEDELANDWEEVNG